MGVIEKLGAQGVAGVGNAMRLIRIGADEQHVVGVFDIFGGMAGLVTKEATVDPEVAGLFLRQRRIDEAALHRLVQLLAVHATQMVALATATVKGKGRSAMLLADCRQAPCNLVQRLVPADANEAAVGLTLQGVPQAILMMLIVFQTGRFLADVPPGYRMFLVAANARELPIFYGDCQSAIARTEDAGCFLGALVSFGSHHLSPSLTYRSLY